MNYKPRFGMKNVMKNRRFRMRTNNMRGYRKSSSVFKSRTDRF